MTATTTSRTEDRTLPTRCTPQALAARLGRVPAGLELLPNAQGYISWAAPLWVLTAFRADDARIWAHVHPLDGMDFPAILAESGWTRAEYAGLQAAASLCGGDGVRLQELAMFLDEELWHAVLEALRIRRGAPDGGGR